jgi:hypothetical protein
LEVAGLEPVVSVLTEGTVDLQADMWEADLGVVDMREVEAVALEEVMERDIMDMEAVLVAFTEKAVEVVMEEEELSDLEAQVVGPLREVVDLDKALVAHTVAAVV